MSDLPTIAPGRTGEFDINGNPEIARVRYHGLPPLVPITLPPTFGQRRTLNRMVTVRLYGRLGRKYGREHRLSVNSVAEAVRALDVLRPGFKRTIAAMKSYDFAVQVGDRYISENELAMRTGVATISIRPIARGSDSKGILQVIAGVVLIAVGLVLAGTPVGVISPYLETLGVGLILGGIANLIAGTPQNLSATPGKSRASYDFSGAVNVAAQGAPAALTYGKPFCGSVVGSGGIKNKDVKKGSKNTPTPTDPNGGGTGSNGSNAGSGGRTLTARGQGGGGSSPTGGQEDPDNLQSRAEASIQDVIGEGPIRGLVGEVDFGEGQGDRSIYLDDTPLRNPDGTLNFGTFHDPNATDPDKQTVSTMEWHFVTGTQDQDYVPGFDSEENTFSQGQQIKHQFPQIFTFTNANLDAVRFDIRVPRLVHINKKTGDIHGSKAEMLFELNTNGGGWQSVIADEIKGKSSGPYTRTYQIVLPAGSQPGPWQVRATRVTADSTTTRTANDTYVESYTEVIFVKLRHPNTTKCYLKFDAEQFPKPPVRTYHVYGLLVKVPSNYDPDTGTYTDPDNWDGTFVTLWTCNPAWVLWDLLTKNRYGLGQYIDTDALMEAKYEFYRIARHCDELVPDGFGGMERRYECHVYIAGREDAIKVLSDIAGIFRASLAYISGVIYPIQDRFVPPEEYGSIFGPTNVENGEFNFSTTSESSQHTVALVKWNDPADLGREKIEYVEDAEEVARLGVREANITAVGCYSRGRAHRLGRWQLFTEKMRSELCGLRTGLEGATNLPGTVCSVSAPFRTGKTLSGRLHDTNTSVIVAGAGEANINGTYVPNGKDSNGNLKWTQTSGTASIDKHDIRYDTANHSWAILISPAAGESSPSANRHYNSPNVSEQTMPWNLVWMRSPTGAPGTLPAPTLAPSTTSATLDRQITILAGMAYTLSFYDTDGGLTTANVGNAIGAANVITFTAPVAKAPQKEAVWILTEGSLAPELFRVLSVKVLDRLRSEISLVSYNPTIYAQIESGIVLEAPPTQLLPSASACLPAATVVVAERANVDPLSLTRVLEVSWSPSADLFIKDYVVRYRHEEGNWSTLPATRLSVIDVPVGLAGQYDFEVTARNVLGAPSLPATATHYVANVNPLPPTPINGLELVDQGNDTIFTQRDAKIQWRISSNQLQIEIGDDADGGMLGDLQDPLFQAYEVTVWNDDELAWRELVQAPHFEFTLEKNRQANGGIARNTFRFEVRYLDVFNNVSAPATLTVSNPATDPVTNASVAATLQGVILAWENPVAADIDYLELLMSDQPLDDNAPVVGHAAYPATSASLSGLIPPGDTTPRYFWVVSVDTFGNRSQATFAGSVTPGALVGEIVITPDGGNISGLTYFTLQCPSSPLADIYWKVGTTDPDLTDNKYAPTPSISGTVDIAARAYYGGQWGPTKVTHFDLVVNGTATPTFGITPGSYSSTDPTKDIPVSTTTASAQMRYTTGDGTQAAPTSGSGTLVASTSGVVTLPAGHTVIKIMAFRAGWTDSTVATGDYTYVQDSSGGGTPTVVPDPDFDPEPGTYDVTVSVSLIDSLAGVSIRWTSGSTLPTSGSGGRGTLYTGTPINITAAAGTLRKQTIHMIAYKTGLADSAVVSGQFIVDNT